MKRSSLFWMRILLVLLPMAMIPAIGGCGGYSPEAHRVDPPTAKSTLVAVLTSWQEGATPESWRQKKPEVVVQDPDWNAGAKLKSFELLDDGKAVDANLNCRVKLILQIPEKGETERNVSYVVSTSPVLTVFRGFGG